MIGRYGLVGLGALLAAASPAQGDGELIDLILAGETVFVDGGSTVAVAVADTGATPADDEADDDESKAGDPAAAIHPLADDEEKAFSEFIAKAGETRREQFQQGMDRVVEAVVESTKLDGAGQEKLRAQVPAAIEGAMLAWQKKFRSWLQPFLLQSGSPLVTLKQWNPRQMVRGGNPGQSDSADQSDAWKTSLRQILSPEQLAAWEETEKVRRAKVLEEMADFVAAGETQAADIFTKMMERQLGRIVEHAPIDEERQKKLKQAADAAVKATMATWRQKAEISVLEMDEKTREQLRQQGGGLGVDTTDKANQPHELPAWQEARTQILTEAERQQIAAAVDQIRSRRSAALTMTVIAHLDTFVGFSESQREKLLELGVKRMNRLPDPTVDSPDAGYSSIDISQMARQLTSLATKKLSTVLDAAQIKRLKAVTPDQLRGNRSYSRRSGSTEGSEKKAVADEIEAERLIASVVHSEARATKRKALEVMEARLENLSRVVPLAPETVAFLRTAAKGAAEQSAQGTINSLDDYVRQQFQGVKPADVPARLQNFSMPNFGSNPNQGSVESGIWTAAVDRWLTAEQLATWKSENDARDAWRLRGLTAMVVAEIENRVALKPAQIDTLQQKLGAIVRDYDPDFSSMFSFGWHLQGYYNTLPLVLLSEKEMAEIFEEKQLEAVKERCLANISQYGEMLRKQHERRIKNDETRLNKSGELPQLPP